MSLSENKFPADIKILNNVALPSQRQIKQTVASGDLCAQDFNIFRNVMDMQQLLFVNVQFDIY